MSLKTRFGNHGNILDRDEAQAGVMVLDSPLLLSGEWNRLQAHFKGQAAEIDCTFDFSEGVDGLKNAISRIRAEAEEAVREGKSQLFLTDERQSATRCAVSG